MVSFEFGTNTGVMLFLFFPLSLSLSLLGFCCFVVSLSFLAGVICGVKLRGLLEDWEGCGGTPVYRWSTFTFDNLYLFGSFFIKVYSLACLLTLPDVRKPKSSWT